MFTSWIKYGKPSFSLTLNGILAGLVAITAGCDLVSPLVLPSSVSWQVSSWYSLIEFIDTKLHIDDPVGASSVYGVCGIFGTFDDRSLRSMAVPSMVVVSDSSEHSSSVSSVSIFWAAATGIILFWGIKKICGLRVDKRIEEEGLEIYEHGESCYN